MTNYAKLTPEQRKEFCAKNSARRSAKRASIALAQGRTPGKPGKRKFTLEEKKKSLLAAAKRWRDKNLEYVRIRDAKIKSKLRTTPEGRKRLCAIQLKYAANHKEKVKAKNKKWNEKNKKRQEKYKEAHYQVNREKFMRLAREYYASHKEQYAVYGRNYYARKKHNGGTHTSADIYELYYLQQSCCAWCGNMLTSGEKPHVDHWMPLSKGGSNDKSNLRLLHKKCNLSKSAKLPPELKLTGTHS